MRHTESLESHICSKVGFILHKIFDFRFLEKNPFPNEMLFITLKSQLNFSGNHEFCISFITIFYNMGRKYSKGRKKWMKQ